MTPTKAFPPHIEPEERLYRTQDRGLSATFLTLGFLLISIECPPKGMCCFAFLWSEDLDCAATSYWTDQLRVNPRGLIRSLNEVQRMAEARASGGDTVDAS